MNTLMIILLSVLTAQTPAAPSEKPAIDAAARSRELEAEIAAEKQALDAAKRDWDAQIKQKQAARSKLAEEIFTLDLERKRLTEMQAELTESQRRAGEEARQAAAAIENGRAAASTTLDQISVQLSEVAAGEAAAEEARELAAQLRSKDRAAITSALRAAPVLADKVLGEASHLLLRPATVWNAAGKQEQVLLLSAGQIAFAYRAGEGSSARYAIALRSPADAAGYRWTEELTDGLRKQLASAFDALAASTNAPVLVPMDVTGRIRADALSHEESLVDVVRSGGPLMIPIALVGLLCVLLMTERAWTLYLLNTVGAGTVRRVLQLVRDRRYDEAEKAAAEGRGAVARVLHACLKRRGAGQHAMEDSIQEQLLAEVPRLQKYLGGLSMLAAASPLLGLLGTVTGIIQTFAVVKTFGNTNPGYMAGGISEALVTTAGGLIIAIPTLLIVGVLRGRVERLTAEAEKQAATLLNTLAHDHGGAAGRAAELTEVATR